MTAHPNSLGTPGVTDHLRHLPVLIGSCLLAGLYEETGNGVRIMIPHLATLPPLEIRQNCQQISTGQGWRDAQFVEKEGKIYFCLMSKER
ncbi:MAG TPA: hypothetical protein VHA78_00825 [Candidatus Peribacteraceae bacterium]|nr:hypothetical protein [Candidatus Peribacteraceae bacterium]